MKFNLFNNFNLLKNDRDDFLIKKIISKPKLGLFLETFRFAIHIAWCANIYKNTFSVFDQYVFMILRGKKMIQMFHLLYKFPNSYIYEVIKKWESRFPIFIDDQTSDENSLIMIQPRAPIFIKSSDTYSINDKNDTIVNSKLETAEIEIPTISTISIDLTKFSQMIYKWEFVLDDYLLKTVKGSFVNNIDEMPNKKNKSSFREENYNLENWIFESVLEDKK